MSELDPAERAFAKLRQELPSRIRRPGVDAARRRLRRRQGRNTALGIVAMLTAAAASIAVPLVLRPVAGISSPSPRPTAPMPSDTSVPTRQPGPTAPTGRSCISDPVGVSGRTVGQETEMRYAEHGTGRTDRPLCPGVRLKIVWASYTLDENMHARLFQSGFIYIDSDHPRWTVRPQLPQACNTWYVTRSDVPVPGFIEARWRRTTGPAGPFWDAQHGITSIAYSSDTWACRSPQPLSYRTRVTE